MAPVSSRALEPDAARLYDSVRSAHLERFAAMCPAWVLYNDVRYDFDPSLAPDNVHLVRVGRVQALVTLLRVPFRAIEVNEPLMTSRWLDLLGQAAAVRIAGLVRGKRVRVTAYCIAIGDPADTLQRYHVPRPVRRLWTRLILRLIVSGMDRLAIGTQGTWDLMATYVGPAVLERRARLFEALPSRCRCAHVGERHKDAVLFVGAFEERKGIRELMRAWELVPANSGATLHLIGKGSLLDEVLAWATGRAGVSVSVDPRRDEIHAAFRQAHVVVLPSQRYGVWREQVGLPIVEALAHGCEVVTTDETGLAAWLATHGHEVVPLGRSDADLAAGVLRAMAHDRPASKVVGDLPDVDARQAADAWMLGPD